MKTLSVDKQEIEQLLFREASLIDEGQFNEWLELFDDELTYWVPCNDRDIDPELHVNIIYENRARLTERIKRLQSGLAHAQIPPSKTCHLVSNIEVAGSDGDVVTVTAKFVIAELRRSTQTIYAGRYVYHLVRKSDQWKIRMKKVELINNNEFLGNVSFIL
jgi:Small subunit of phenylpropionate dioxygenase